MDYNTYMAETLSAVAKGVATCDPDIEYDLLKDRVAELQDMIANHDCHASQDSGCECSFWKEELRDITGKPKSIII